MSRLTPEQAAAAAEAAAREARGHASDAMDAARRADECGEWRDLEGARSELRLAEAAAQRTREAAKRCHAVCPDSDDWRLIRVSAVATDAVHSADAAVIGAQHAVGS